MALNVKAALRQLAKAPGFSIAALLILGIGIGANTAMFSVVHAVLLHKLPYPQADRIISISRERGGSISVPVFTYFQESNTGLADLSAYQASTLSTLGGNTPESIDSVRASSNYFKLFGAVPLLGRTFSETEDRPGGGNVAVISFALWQRTFGSDPAAIGRTITLDGVAYNVIGVLPQSYQPYPAAEVWTPLQADAASQDQAGILGVSGRLPSADAISAARARMTAIGQEYIRTHPSQIMSEGTLEITPLQQQIVGDIRPQLLILFGAVGLIMLIACANVANLVLARTAVRRRELAIRVAVGASRGRIIRLLLRESLLLAAGGGLLGWIFGSAAVRLFLALSPDRLARINEIPRFPALDPWVTGFTLSISGIAGIVFAFLPAARLPLSLELKTSLKPNRSHVIFVAIEMAMAVVLLCGAILMLRSLAALQTITLGFDPDNILTMQVPLHGPNYSKSTNVDRLAREMVDRIEVIPGVESAAVVSALPLFGQMDMVFTIPGQPLPDDRKFSGDVQWRFISPNYFQVLRMPAVSGRFMTPDELRPAVVINEAMAHEFWPGSNPVGATIRIGGGLSPEFDQGVTEIVGVVSDERVRLNTGAVPIMYQLPRHVSDAALALMNRLQTVAILVRTRPGTAPLTVSHTVAQEVASVSKQPVGNIQTMNDARLHSTARENFNSTLLGLFAAIAILLAAVGLFGVMSYEVRQRTREIGIRIAIGANRSSVRNLVLLRALRISLTGGMVGLFASVWLTGLLRSQLFGVTRWDPFTFGAVLAILFAATFAAAYIPASRASRTDPVVTLRHE